MAYLYTQQILDTECIGNSLNDKINPNFLGLDEAVQSLSALTLNVTSFRNKLINAQGLVNQRVYVSGTVTTIANQYTLDRWRVVTLSQNLTFSTSQNVVTFTAPAGGIEQVIEGNNIETGTYVLNWTGTATATVNGTARTKGQTFSLTGGSNVTVTFSNGTFSLPQLEKATKPLAFEYRPFGVELALCQRYYEKSYPVDVAPGAVDDYRGSTYELQAVYTTNAFAGALLKATFKQTKRTSAPTITVYNPNNGTANQLSIWSNGTTWNRNVAISTPVADHSRALIWPIASTTVNSGYICIAHWAVDAEL